MSSKPVFRLQISSVNMDEIASTLRIVADRIESHRSLAHVIRSYWGERLGSCGLDVSRACNTPKETPNNVDLPPMPR